MNSTVTPAMGYADRVPIGMLRNSWSVSRRMMQPGLVVNDIHGSMSYRETVTVFMAVTITANMESGKPAPAAIRVVPPAR